MFKCGSVNFVVEQFQSNFFLPDGEWNFRESDDWETLTAGHSHSRLATIASCLNLGIVEQDSALIAMMKRYYEWFSDNFCSSAGWSPEFLGRYGVENEGRETCTVMDHIRCCLALAQAGHTEYYKKAEKIFRNQLLENQLLDTSLFRQTIERADTELSCFHGVAEMVRGGFAGWAGPNDFQGNCANNDWLMNCCGPSGIRAMHEV